MGAAFGGKTNSSQILKYSSLQVSTSLLDVPVSLMWGQRRVSPNCIWYNNFKAKSVDKGGGGGKGGGKSGQYTYSAAVILALGEGVMSSPLNVWGPSSTVTTTTLSDLGLTFFSGTAVQAPWSFVSTNYPAQARSYQDTCYVASPNLDLGESAAVPDYAFEIQRLMSFTDTLVAAGWTNPATSVNTPGTDCSLADIIPDFLTNPIYGLSFANADIGSLTQFRAYQDAQGLYFSPLLTDQEKATEILDRWAALSNSWIYWSGTQIQFVPLGDSALTGYTPDLTAAYNLGLKDFIVEKGDAPIEITRQDPADCYNRTRLEITDRTRGYVANPIEWRDQYLVDKFGIRDNASTQADDVCNPAVGQICAQLIGRRAAYIRNTYKFKLSYRYIRLLPGSIVTLTNPNQGLNQFPVRIRSVDEDDNDLLQIQAEELPAGIGTYYASTYPTSATATTQDTNVAPGSVNTPCVVEPSSAFAQGQALILIAASGGENWGGCNVILSLDGTDFAQIGTITATALQGVLTSNLTGFSGTNPDTTHTLAIDVTESDGILPSVSHTIAANFVSLAYVSPQPTSSGGDLVLSNAGELLSFGAVTSAGTFTGNLTYLYRSLYGTSGVAGQSSGAQFTALDVSGNTGSTLKHLLGANYIGQTLYLKFQSFNIFGNAAEDPSTLQVYTYTPNGTGYGGGSGGVPLAPASLTATPGSSSAELQWPANAPSDNVTSYTIWAANGTSQPFSSAVEVWQGDSLATILAGLTPNAGYTFFLTANNQVGSSTPTSGVNCTINAASAGANITAASSPITVTPTGGSPYYANVDNTSGAPLTVKISRSVPSGQVVVIVDAGGNAATNNFAIQDTSGNALGTITSNGGTNSNRWNGSAYLPS